MLKDANEVLNRVTNLLDHSLLNSGVVRMVSCSMAINDQVDDAPILIERMYLAPIEGKTWDEILPSLPASPPK